MLASDIVRDLNSAWDHVSDVLAVFLWPTCFSLERSSCCIHAAAFVVIASPQKFFLRASNMSTILSGLAG